jgi:hypothetical protein
MIESPFPEDNPSFPSLDLTALRDLMDTHQIEKIEITVERGNVETPKRRVGLLESSTIEEDVSPLYRAMTGVFQLMPAEDE